MSNHILCEDNIKLRSIMGRQVLWKMTPEILAVNVLNRKRTSSGHNYARKPDIPAKIRCRAEILRYLTRENIPKGLSILTMPGLYWRFEHSLLQMREKQNSRKVHNTYICSVENDEALYRTALKNIPISGYEDTSIVSLKKPIYSTYTLRTYFIVRYHKADVEQVILNDKRPFDVAWLDFCGPISVKRLDAVKYLWENRIKKYLFITSMAARYERDISKQIEEYGFYRDWLIAQFLNSKLLHCFEYSEPTPMVQIGISKI